MKHFSFILSCTFAMLLAACPVKSQKAEGGKPLIYVIDIKKEINKTTEIYLSKGLKEAQRRNASTVLIHMNTYGGLLESADSMRTAVLYSPVPVHVFIDNNAASAGALISIACKKIFMRRGASIGAATVVNETGSELPDKYQSYMRSLMRSTAESHGKDTVVQGADTIFRWKRDPLIAEAMVDDRIVVLNLIDSGKTLTLTTEEALRWGYCDGMAESTDEVITRFLGYSAYETEVFSPSWTDNLMGFLMNPAVQSLLILIIIGGIYFELQTPGMGFPAAASVMAAVVYFAPLYIEGLAQNWEILVFVIGVILLLVELFVIPGFGISGIAGILCIIFALTVSLIDNSGFDFEGIEAGEAGEAAMTVLVGLVCGFIAIIWLSSKIGEKRGFFRRIALHADLEQAVSVPAMNNLKGTEGIAATVLRPAGKVSVGDELYDAVSESGFIEKGCRVRVVRFENAQIYVVRG